MKFIAKKRHRKKIVSTKGTSSENTECAQVPYSSKNEAQLMFILHGQTAQNPTQAQTVKGKRTQENRSWE